MIVKRKESSSKKVCFSTPDNLYRKYKDLKKIANENGLEVEINLELQKFFEKLIKKAEKDLAKLISEKQAVANFGSDTTPEL